MQSVTLIITGGIAAYKALELARLLKKAGTRVIPILSRGGAQFVTPLSLAALTEEKVYSDIFSLTDEQEMGHIRLSRISDLMVVAPASADMLAKMAHGVADDLASTVLLASNKPIMVCPAMNPEMWKAPATQANIKTLEQRGVIIVGPASGDTACGEDGMGRLAEPADIFKAIQQQLSKAGPLSGKRVIVTAGPTHEAIDPVRFIGNQSSGKQGYAIAEALAAKGASVTLISGPTALPPPKNARVINVISAADMLRETQAALPADIAIFAAAVADWRVSNAAAIKIKKGSAPPTLQLEENPDILATIAAHKNRPRLVVGFAAETGNLKEEAAAKRARKNCDWLLANDVSKGVFGSDSNEVLFVDAKTTDPWPRMTKAEVAIWLADRIVQFIK